MWMRYETGVSGKITRYVKTLRTVSGRDTELTVEKTLRRRRVKTITAVWPFYDVAIGMDELYLPATLTYIYTWWEADQAWIHLSTDASTEPLSGDAGWIEVTLDGGPLPLTYPTGDKALPSLATTIYATQGV